MLYTGIRTVLSRPGDPDVVKILHNLPYCRRPPAAMGRRVAPTVRKQDSLVVFLNQNYMPQAGSFSVPSQCGSIHPSLN